jgi:hypothetical protein
MRQRQFEKGLQDARKSIELNEKWIKGHYYVRASSSYISYLKDQAKDGDKAGQCLVDLGRPSEALSPLKKAYQLALGDNVDLALELVDYIRQTRKAKWELSEVQRRARESDLFGYLSASLQRDRERQIGLCPDTEWTSINERYDSKLAAIHDLFDRAETRPGPVPDAFLGKISFELMLDPVVTPSGITYDRTELRDHLRKIGPFDPLSREPLKADDLIPNLALKGIFWTGFIYY